MNTFKLKSITTMVMVALLTFSCSKDDNDDLVITDPDATFDAELIVSESGVGDMRNVMVTADGTTMSTIKAKVKFSSTSKSMRRLYITQNVAGTGAQPFVFTSQEVDEKPDGSLDLVGGDKKDFEFQIDLNAPSVDGDIVYTFWATTGRGDFRDSTKRNALGDFVIGTITVKFGTGVNNASGISEFTNKLLAAPLGDFSSDSFISVYNGEIYKITDGEENAALWDFGYYYGNTNNASLASTDNYPDNIINVPMVANTPADEKFTNVYFKDSSLDYDAITTAAQIESDVTASPASDSERITNLSVNDVIEFYVVRDNYETKGLIKVIAIAPGFGSSGSITLAIKVQNQD